MSMMNILGRIKFKGKRVDNGEWVYGYYSACVERGDNGGIEHLFKETHTLLHYISTINGDVFLVYPETVGQFIGKADMREKEIFEGDLLDSPDREYDEPFIVVWDNEDSCYGLRCIYHGRVEPISIFHLHEMEIVGSIYDNLGKVGR